MEFVSGLLDPKTEDKILSTPKSPGYKDIPFINQRSQVESEEKRDLPRRVVGTLHTPTHTPISQG